jgi:hypothetical protein
MKLIAVILAGAALTVVVIIEMWHLSGQRFWLFCALLLFASESVFLSARLLGDDDATNVLGWRFCGFSDWAVASLLVAVVVLGLIACSVVAYQVVSLAPVGACREICLP